MKLKRITRLFLVCLFLLSQTNFGLINSQAASKVGQTGYVNYTYLNLRKESSSNSTLIVKLSQNDRVTVLEDHGAWLKVTAVHDNKTYIGYVWYSYITLTGKASDSGTSSGSSASGATTGTSGSGSTGTSGSGSTGTSGSGNTGTSGSGNTGTSGSGSTGTSGTNNSGTSGSDNSTGATSSSDLTGYVNFTYLRLRKQPNTKCDVVVQLSKNDRVTISEKLDGWYKVKAVHAGKTYSGYVASRYITLNKTSGSTGSGTTTSGNSGSSTSSENSGATSSGSSGTQTSGSSVTKTKAVTMASVYVSSSGSAKITWNKIEDTDGYLIYRKISGGSYKQVASVDANTSSYSEKGLSQNTKYTYMVTGYKLSDGKKVQGETTSGLAPTLPYSGEYVFNVTKTRIGLSGAGRAMYSYTIGSGKNHLVITCEVHGYEDSYAKDGLKLVQTGEAVVKKAADNTSLLKSKDYTLIIIPMSNPDGLLDGSTNNGPGRTTTYRYNDSGKLEKGGVNINRSFPTTFRVYKSSRNYTGNSPLLCRESRNLRAVIDKNLGNGKNVFIDVHGWYNQTITKKSGSGEVYSILHKYFPSTRAYSLGVGDGYVAKYASAKGYDAALFEFPYVKSAAAFDSAGYKNKFVNAMMEIVKNY